MHGTEQKVLKGRARLAGLRNSYKDTMDRLQKALEDHFAAVGDDSDGVDEGPTGASLQQ